jgi:hypothetical protein
MKNDSVIPVFVVSLIFGGFVFFDMNRKIEDLKNEVVSLQIHLSQKEARNLQFVPTPSQVSNGFYNGR